MTKRIGDLAASLILCGHSHVPRTVVLKDGRTVCNPGSVGLQAYASDHTSPHRVESGSALARCALIERDATGWRIESVAVLYDHASAADKAEREGRLGWAIALRWGRMGP